MTALLPVPGPQGRYHDMTRTGVAAYFERALVEQGKRFGPYPWAGGSASAEQFQAEQLAYQFSCGFPFRLKAE